MSAKAWIEKMKCSSLALQKACMAQTYMQMFSKVDIASVVHHPGKDMKDIDFESRREEYLQEHEFCSSLPPECEIDLDSYPIVKRFIELSNPTEYNPCLQDMHEAYLGVAKEFGAFIHRSNPPPVVYKSLPAKYNLVYFDHEKKKRVTVVSRVFV
jgi:hypothetical protein